ncbi:hypothetical protein AYO38_04040 [bacterium SCGC AG-212-C10]|nr:hypothetical protein AYO38_04040 [bacterium SCGC AG-212-C10]
MFEYNRWANLRLIDFCEALPEEQQNATVAGTFGSIRQTLTHLVGSQDVFLWRMARDDAELEANAAQLRGPWQSWDVLRAVDERGAAGLIVAARDADGDPEVTLPPYFDQHIAVPKSFLFLHAMYHGIEHRGQICTTLTQIGVEPPDLDGWGYAAAAGIGRPA